MAVFNIVYQTAIKLERVYVTSNEWSLRVYKSIFQSNESVYSTMLFIKQGARSAGIC